MRALLMRLALASTLLICIACNQDLRSRPPIENRFYYPTGVAFVPPASSDGGLGRLYVASSNFDRRFDLGWVTGVDLSQVRTTDGRALPPPGVPILAPPDGGSDQGRPVQFSVLTPDGGPAPIVTIASFAGLATVDTAGTRLYVPSRSEGDELAVMDVTQTDGGAPLRCFFSGGNDCTVDALRLAEAQAPGDIGVPAAPQPYSVTLAPDGGDIFVTHVRPASSPAQSFTNLQNFLVTLNTADLDAARASYGTNGRYVVPDDAFSSIGRGSTNTIVLAGPFLYASGRGRLSASDPDALLRVIDLESRLLEFPAVSAVYPAATARGLQLNPSGNRLYMAVDSPAALLVFDVTEFLPGGLTQVPPQFTLVRAVPLPEGPNDVAVIPREGQAPLIAISCTIDGSLAFYDDELGQIAALVQGVGAEPFAIAVDRRGDVVRLYVSNFADGRIAVLDIGLGSATSVVPLAPRLVAHIGAKQYCLLSTDDPNCVDGSP